MPNQYTATPPDQTLKRRSVKGEAPGSCWIWTGCRNKAGYGLMRFRKSGWLVHRVAWTLSHGEIPEGKFVLHACDNPSCINPDHLFLGTQRDNIIDMAAKDRHGRAKIKRSQRLLVREMGGQGTPQRLIAERLGISQTHVSRLMRGRTSGSNPLATIN